VLHTNKHVMSQFTEQKYNAMVYEDEEQTFRYRFMPMNSLDLDPVKYNLALTVFYENEEELFSTTFFNETVSFSDDENDTGILGLAMYAGAALAAIGAYFAFSGGKTTSFVSSNGSSSEGSEWVQGLDVQGANSSGKQVKKRRNKKKSSKKKSTK